MLNPAIRISNLSKAYRIQRNDAPRATNLGEAVTRKLRAPFKRTATETFWALKDIDLEIERGEVVGVIGRNGAGKSTLLKILSRITEPTTGRIELFGRVGSLLEVGTGFHPELTGRENIFLNGAILGMKRGEIKKHFDEIVDFAGVEKFLDTPVKRYSSGMYVRLAFAVAAHLNPEILIVDEVLAVGDAEFQKKCLGKMQDVARGGRTVLFVSHNIRAISQLCTASVILESGRVSRVGCTPDILSFYSTPTHRSPTTVLSLEGHSDRYGDGPARFTRATLLDAKRIHSATFMTGDKIIIEAELHTNSAAGICLSVTCQTNDGIPVLQGAHHDTTGFEADGGRDTLKFRVTIDELPLQPGSFRWLLACHGPSLIPMDVVRGVLPFAVVENDQTNPRPYSSSAQHGLCWLNGKWENL